NGFGSTTITVDGIDQGSSGDDHEGGGTDSTGTATIKILQGMEYDPGHIFATLPDGKQIANTATITATGNINLLFQEASPNHKLTGTVYKDNNQNGFRDSGENGYSGATVSLSTGQTATTDA